MTRELRTRGDLKERSHVELLQKTKDLFLGGYNILIEAEIDKEVPPFRKRVEGKFSNIDFSSALDLSKEEIDAIFDPRRPPFYLNLPKAQISLSWGFDEGENIIWHSILVTANSETKEIVVSGRAPQKLSRSEWSDKETLRIALEEAFRDPWIHHPQRIK